MKIQNFILLVLCLSYMGNFFAAAQTDVKRQYEFSNNGFLAAIHDLNILRVSQFLNDPQMTLEILKRGLRLAEKHQRAMSSKSQENDVIVTDLLSEGEEVDQNQMKEAAKLSAEADKLKKIIDLLQSKITTMEGQLKDQKQGCTDCVIL